MRKFALRPMEIFLPVLHLRSRMSKKNYFCPGKSMLGNILRKFAQTKNLIKISNFLHFRKK